MTEAFKYLLEEISVVQTYIWVLENENWYDRLKHRKSLQKWRGHLEGLNRIKTFMYQEYKKSSEYNSDSLEKLALEVREVIFAVYPEYAEKYQGELLHSPEYVFDIAELICKEQEESE